MVDGKCYLSFKDGQGFPHKLELDVKLYALFDRFELDDLSFLNEQERHLDQTELSEALLSRRVPENQATVEDAVYESLQTQALSFACFPVTRERALLFDNFIVQRIFYFPSAVPERDKLQEHKPGWPTDTGNLQGRQSSDAAAHPQRGP